MNAARIATALGAAGALLAVALGAFGAHALAARLGERGRDLWRTAERYQFVHSLALLVLGASAAGSGMRTPVLWLFTAGIALFCGSLYALGLGAPRRLGAVTPLGGLAFLAAWALWLESALFLH